MLVVTMIAVTIIINNCHLRCWQMSIHTLHAVNTHTYVRTPFVNLFYRIVIDSETVAATVSFLSDLFRR